MFSLFSTLFSNRLQTMTWAEVYVFCSSYLSKKCRRVINLPVTSTDAQVTIKDEHQPSKQQSKRFCFAETSEKFHKYFQLYYTEEYTWAYSYSVLFNGGTQTTKAVVKIPWSNHLLSPRLNQLRMMLITKRSYLCLGRKGHVLFVAGDINENTTEGIVSFFN